MWTDHCLQTGDSGFPTTLKGKINAQTVVHKGTNQFVDAYSAFMDNTKTLKTKLDDELIAKGVNTLYITGIATDVCVKATVTDALGSNTANYTVYVVRDATAAVLGNVANYDAALTDMASTGATLVTTADVLAMKCPATPAVATTSGVGEMLSFHCLGLAFLLFFHSFVHVGKST